MNRSATFVNSHSTCIRIYFLLAIPKCDDAFSLRSGWKGLGISLFGSNVVPIG